MSNLRIVSNNIGKTATLVASSEAGALVASNMQLDSKTQVWRSAGTTESITATFASITLSAVALVISNLTATATMRVRVYVGAAVQLDTGNVLCCEYTTIEKIDFGNGPLNANTFSYGGGTYSTLYFSETVGDKVIIDIIDTSNSAGYIDVSSIVIGQYWSPVDNADYGAALDFNDTSKHSRNDSGDLMTDRGAVYKGLVFSFSQMQTADRTALMSIIIRNSMAVPIFISIFPDSNDEQEKQMYQIYGKRMKKSSFSRYKPQLDKSLIRVEEI